MKSKILYFFIFLVLILGSLTLVNIESRFLGSSVVDNGQSEESIMADIYRLNREIEDKRSQLDAWQNALSTNPDAQEMIEENIRDIQAQIIPLEEERNDLQTILNNRSQQEKNRQEEAYMYQEKISKFYSEIYLLNNEKSILVSQLSQTQTHIEKITQDIAALVSQEEKQNILLQPLQESITLLQSQLTTLDREIEATQQEKRDIENQIQTAKTAKSNAEIEQKDISKNKIPQVKSQITQWGKDLKKLEGQKNIATRIIERNTLKQQTQTTAIKKQISTLSNQINTSKAQSGITTAEMAVLEKNPENFITSDFLAKITQKQAEKNQKTLELDTLNKRLKELTAIINKSNKDIALLSPKIAPLNKKIQTTLPAQKTPLASKLNTIQQKELLPITTKISEIQEQQKTLISEKNTLLQMIPEINQKITAVEAKIGISNTQLADLQGQELGLSGGNNSSGSGNFTNTSGGYCGDGIVQNVPSATRDGEECDDGNNKGNDGCSAQCLLEPCYKEGKLSCDLFCCLENETCKTEQAQICQSMIDDAERKTNCAEEQEQIRRIQEEYKEKQMDLLRRITQLLANISTARANLFTDQINYQGQHQNDENYDPEGYKNTPEYVQDSADLQANEKAYEDAQKEDAQNIAEEAEKIRKLEEQCQQKQGGNNNIKNGDLNFVDV